MLQAFGSFVVLFAFSSGLVAFAVVSVFRLAPEAAQSRELRWLAGWSGKGLALPLLLWMLMNLGLSFELQPFMPQIQAARNAGGNWLPVFLKVTAGGWFAISSYWVAVTLAWIVVRAGRRLDGEERDNFKALCWTSLVGMALPALGILLLGGWLTLGLALMALLAPVAGYAPGVNRRRKLPPMYSRAVARMKHGKYSEAEWEVLRELENHEDDFEGWMMLAELYANHFNDLPGAEQTVLEICDQPRTTPSQLSVALHRLADWQLALAGDPEAARRSLEVVCHRLPGTHLAHMAQQRIAQLPATAEEWREEHQNKPVHLPALGDRFEEMPSAASEPTEAAKARAKQLTEKLRRDPDHAAAREELARLCAEQLGQASQAIGHAEHLLTLPGQPDARRAEWMACIAAWRLRLEHNAAAARETLAQLVREFPGSPQALAAERKLLQLETESRIRESPPAAPARIKIEPTAPPPPAST